ncbi:hypothetical protein X566_12950 [Afipia sp. P52-10]|uniref:DUF1800 domain-containing protein n=1 Tax=Afipia sp. P52-10 TaxID=1429916 RepID=UPI0003DF1974|nr:DUF1800 family protein [Afipia sp. P52-10]ETR78465.1 hypothetical protein X566_12950 [Afipia sp. P52-10]
MARDPQGAWVALNRFGFGARGDASGDFANAASDPRGFIRAELERPALALLESSALRSSPELGQAFFSFREEERRQRLAADKNGPLSARAPLELKLPETKSADAAKPVAKPSEASADSARLASARPAEAKQATASAESAPPNATQPNQVQPAAPGAAPARPAPQPLNVIQKTYRNEALARFQRATLTEAGFIERLVTFWSNHFCISANKGPLARIWAGAFEREAIRPHVLGRFADMVLAAESHPAMLFFLDNQQSLGPNSRAGLNRNRGLNENLAREIMELHTLGVGGGYTQDDVTALARIITGWTFAGPDGRLGEPGAFAFNANAHEPGTQELLGKSYAEDGVEQGRAALNDLARHPSTAKFIATKLARHFVADDPPPALVARLARRFAKSDGDLKAVAIELLDADEAWSTPLGKIRSPYEVLIATGRLLARVPDQPSVYLNSLNVLGQPLWSPAGPNGFPDTNATWASPEGMKLRLDLASQLAARLGDAYEPRELIDVVAGAAASQQTRQTIARAETRQQAMALLLMSPEFQRR